MSTDAPTGWIEAAEILDTLRERFEQAENIADALPDGYRAVELSTGAGWHIEKQTEYFPMWVPVAEFVDTDARHEWSDDIHKGTDDEYRCVMDYEDGTVYLEVRVDE